MNLVRLLVIVMIPVRPDLTAVMVVERHVEDRTIAVGRVEPNSAVRRVPRRRQPLRVGVEGLADHADLAGRPGLTRDPLDRVVDQQNTPCGGSRTVSLLYGDTA